MDKSSDQYQRLEELNALIPEEDDVMVRLDMIQERLSLREKFNNKLCDDLERFSDTLRRKHFEL